jgi:hypothetical protein
MAIDLAGNYYFCNQGASTVDRITPGGTRSTFATLDAGSVPFSISIGPDGNIWVGDVGHNQIEEFSNAGVFIGRYSTNVNNPCGILVMPASASDFGDLPSRYATRLAHNGARHIIGTLRMGTNLDADGDGLASTGGNGDDSDSDGDDEDGVTIPTLTAGSTASVTVNSSGTGRINAFFDWNNDNDFLDAGEAITEMSVAAGNNTLNVPVPAAAVAGTQIGARFRLSTAGALTATGGAVDGEVEDYLVTVPATRDFGDWNGSGAATTTASSAVNTNLRLGAAVDAEGSVTPDTAATADGADEDGVTMPAVIMQSQRVTIPVSVFNNTGGNRFLHAWIDFNSDGSFNDTVVTSGGERLEAVRTISTSASTQNISLVFDVPAGAIVGMQRGVRFRISDSNTTTPTFTGGVGEIEDYIVRICPLIVVCPAINILPVGTVSSAYSLPITALGGAGGFTYAVTAGSVPAGLTLNTSTGTLSGTPTTANTSNFTVTATDSAGCTASRAYTMTVVAAGATIQVFGEAGTNNVPVTAASYVVNGTPATQSADVAGTTVVTATNNTVSLSTLTINDAGTSKTLNVANLNGGTVSNVTLSTSQGSFGVFLNGTTTSIASSGLATFQTNAAAISTNTNLNHYIYDDRGEGEPDATGEYDIRFNYAFNWAINRLFKNRFK